MSQRPPSGSLFGFGMFNLAGLFSKSNGSINSVDRHLLELIFGRGVDLERVRTGGKRVEVTVLPVTTARRVCLAMNEPEFGLYNQRSKKRRIIVSRFSAVKRS